MKDAARLLSYFVATIVIGALLAPPLYWLAQSLVAHGWFGFLAKFDFETYFHRALLVAALALLWPLFRSINIRGMPDLGLEENPRRRGDFALGVILSAIPLLCCGAVLIALNIFSVRRGGFLWPVFGRAILSALGVSLIEEAFFRGLLLGVLLRSGKVYLSIFATSAFFAIVHFLKAPQRASEVVTWTSGFSSIANAFSQFADPMFVAAAFTTLFVIGWILADARVRTKSLWLPIGLHAGWIFANGTFSALARREVVALPWLGKNLLVGIVPLGVAALTWLLIRLIYGRASNT